MFYTDLREYPFCDDILPTPVFTEGLDRWQLHLHCEGSGEGSCHLRRYSKVCRLHHVGAHCRGGRCGGESPGRVSDEKQPSDELMRPKVIQIFFCVVVRLPLMRTPLQPLGNDIFEYLWNLVRFCWNLMEFSRAEMHFRSRLIHNICMSILSMPGTTVVLYYCGYESSKHSTFLSTTTGNFWCSIFFSFFSNKLAWPFDSQGFCFWSWSQICLPLLRWAWSLARGRWTKCSEICWMLTVCFGCMKRDFPLR